MPSPVSFALYRLHVSTSCGLIVLIHWRDRSGVSGSVMLLRKTALLDMTWAIWKALELHRGETSSLIGRIGALGCPVNGNRTFFQNDESDGSDLRLPEDRHRCNVYLASAGLRSHIRRGSRPHLTVGLFGHQRKVCVKRFASEENTSSYSCLHVLFLVRIQNYSLIVQRSTY